MFLTKVEATRIFFISISKFQQKKTNHYFLLCTWKLMTIFNVAINFAKILSKVGPLNLVTHFFIISRSFLHSLLIKCLSAKYQTSFYQSFIKHYVRELEDRTVGALAFSTMFKKIQGNSIRILFIEMDTLILLMDSYHFSLSLKNLSKVNLQHAYIWSQLYQFSSIVLSSDR